MIEVAVPTLMAVIAAVEIDAALRLQVIIFWVFAKHRTIKFVALSEKHDFTRIWLGRKDARFQVELLILAFLAALIR